MTRLKKWAFRILGFLALIGLYVVYLWSKSNPDSHSRISQITTTADLLRMIEKVNVISVTQQPPVETTLKLPRTNPLLELKRNGIRDFSLLPSQGVISKFHGTINAEVKPSAVDHRKKNNITSFNYGTCSLQNAMCVVSHPLPVSLLPHAVTFCVHDGKDFVSDSIRAHGVWERRFIYYIWATLVQNPDMHFIDMGANIGAMTLVVAKIGRKVVAIEPLKASLDILCKAVIVNDVTDKVTIMPFALSDQRTTSKIDILPNNWGGAHLVKGQSAVVYSEIVPTILTDDLLEFITFDKALLKIDIEGFEPAALRSATKLFEKVFIPVIVMEWARMQENIARGDADCLFVLEFLYSRGYSAYTDRGVKLDRKHYANRDSWGDDINWVHDIFTFEIDPWSLFDPFY